MVIATRISKRLLLAAKSRRLALSLTLAVSLAVLHSLIF